MPGKRILLVNTFPIKDPQSGGQKREAAIVQAYKKYFDVVQYVGVFFKGYYKQYDETDIPLSPGLTESVNSSPHTVDMICGNAIYEDPAVKSKMTKILQELKPDIVQIEQVFPYFGMKRLLEELGMHPKIILSSHNVEAPHKREILKSVGMENARIEKIFKQIDDLEKELARTSDLVIACTESDKKYYEANGAKNTVLARNGMAPLKTTESAMMYWHKYYAERGIKKTALFVASAHPPNWNGFTKMVGLSLGFVPFDTRIVMAGGIADYFKSNINEPYNIQHQTFWHRILMAGRVDNDSLDALIRIADVILLPIVEGGGSNLKTAEAILADKSIVATSHAFRSFETLQDLPNIYMADDQDHFTENILKALSSPRQDRTAAERTKAASVTWDQCLSDAAREASKL